MIIGNKKEINLSSNQFKKFIGEGYLYVDKTKFIENILSEASDALLITRPRRIGKSLNLDTLRTFLDCKLETKELFKGLYISNSTYFKYINKYPVIYLDFKVLNIELYKIQFQIMIKKIAGYYLNEEQIDQEVSDSIINKGYLDTNILLYLTENIYNVYRVEPIIIIDEYDKILMDNMRIKDPEYEALKKFVTAILNAGLKGNPYLKKAILMGVTRISKESMFSDLNNLKVIDVLTPSIFDSDFGLTEEDVKELLSLNELHEIRNWYNNLRVGNAKLFNIYSIMSYLDSERLDSYWGRSGTEDLIKTLLTYERKERILSLVNDLNASYKTTLEPKISVSDLLNSKSSNLFYSLLVQTGYLSYDISLETDVFGEDLYDIYVPNLELRRVWRNFILRYVADTSSEDLRDILNSISDIPTFNQKLKQFIDFRLSYHDIEKELEKPYHILILGMLVGVGIKCKSNVEAGHGRYDIAAWGKDFNIIFEFKKANKKEALEKATIDALKQIDDRKYYVCFKSSLPIYKVGIACYKKSCLVKTVLHEKPLSNSPSI